jgi:hypothetical protein
MMRVSAKLCLSPSPRDGGYDIGRAPFLALRWLFGRVGWVGEVERV